MKFSILLTAVAALGSSGALGAACKPRPSTSVSTTESLVTASETTTTTAVESLSTLADEPSSSTKEESISAVLTEASYTTASTTESLPTTIETLSTVATGSSFTTITTSAESTTTLSTTSSVPEPEPTYITNERFDASSDSYAPWAFASVVNDASLSLTPTSVSAPNALKLTYTGVRAHLVVGQRIDASNLVAGVPYLATVWLRSNALSTAGSCSSMVIRASAGYWSYDRLINSGQLPVDTWVQLRTRITFTAAQIATNPSLYLSGSGCGPGDYLFDDVTFGIAPSS